MVPNSPGENKNIKKKAVFISQLFTLKELFCETVSVINYYTADISKKKILLFRKKLTQGEG